MAYALADDAKTCILIAPFCKKEDVQKAAHHALLKNMCQSFLALHAYYEMEITPHFLYEIIVSLKEYFDSFYCKQNIQKAIEEPSVVAKRKM